MSIQFTDTQFAMLSDAARREDRSLVASPSLRGGAKMKVANKLISAGVVAEIEAKAGALIWRRDNEVGKAYTLKLTAEGAKAIGLGEDLQRVVEVRLATPLRSTRTTRHIGEPIVALGMKRRRWRSIA